jgi:hypothetical protein
MFPQGHQITLRFVFCLHTQTQLKTSAQKNLAHLLEAVAG